jgi:hypothetical protein
MGPDEKPWQEVNVSNYTMGLLEKITDQRNKEKPKGELRENPLGVLEYLVFKEALKMGIEKED